MLAYIDSFGGLVPCKVLDMEREADGVMYVAVKVTAERSGYKRGQTVVGTGRLIVPRDAVYRSRQACGQFRIKPYNWDDYAAAVKGARHGH